MNISKEYRTFQDIDKIPSNRHEIITMDPQLCRTLNFMSLKLLALYLDVPVEKVNTLYEELLEDENFLNEINERIAKTRPIYQKGIFKHEKLDSIDWMSIQRIMLCVLVRLYKPSVCVETGVFYGGNTCFILNALRKNKHGKLISIDLPGNLIQSEKRHHLVGDSENVPRELDVGFIVHENQKKYWTLIRGDSHMELPKINEKIDLFIHDSDHSFDFIKKELNIIWKKLNSDSVILADDLDWSNGFYSFCVDKKLYPLIITDNGKSELKARTGIAKVNHPFRFKSDVVGE